VEYESYAGRWERSYSMIDVVLVKATKFEDKLRAYYAKLEGLGAQLKISRCCRARIDASREARGENASKAIDFGRICECS
jgi:hypothetical protein